MKTFFLPDLGEGLPDAVIREWYIKEGDTVAIDQPLVAMETAKALVDIPAPYAGIIHKLHGKEGDTIDTGDALIEFASKAEDTPTSADSGTVVGKIDSSETLITSKATQHVSNKHSSGIKATPAVRMLAKQLGVDLATLATDGQSITAAQVKVAASQSTTATTAQPNQQNFNGTAYALPPSRRAMIQAMQLSHDNVVPVTLTGEANIHAWTGKQDMTVRLVQAVCAASQAEPNLNALFDLKAATLYQQEQVNIAIAVDTPEGLFVPVLKAADQKDAAGIRAEINRFKAQAADKTFPPEDLKGSSILLSNVGSIAGTFATPIVMPPMVCSIAIGRAADKLVLQDGVPSNQRVIPISITTDHQAITGGEMSRFLAAFISALEASQ